MKQITGLSAFSVLLLFSGCTLFESSKKQTKEDTVIARVDNTPVTFQNFYDQFSRSGAMISDAEKVDGLREFYPLFIDYKIKLRVAEEAGYFEDPELLAELNQYEQQASYPFWIEKEIKDALVEELVERSKIMISGQHMLISIDDGASPGDTLDVYNRLMEARERFLDGEDFLKLSEEYSSRRQGRSMGGDLGYFSAGWAVKPFEDVVYSLQPGEVSKPFRSPFGYHIVHVKEHIETPPDKYFSHIFFRTRQRVETQQAIWQEAREAFDALEEGMEWMEAVETFSQDPRGKDTGGAIGWVRYGEQFDPSFVTPAVKLEEPGTYSEPFQSTYGIHIVRLDSIREVPEEELRENLEDRLRQLPRYRDNQQAVLGYASRIGNATVHTTNQRSLEALFEAESETPFDSITVPDELLEKPFFSFNRNTWTVADFVEWMGTVSRVQYGSSYHFDLVSEFKNAMMDKELVDLTKNHFPEFRDLSREYHTGLAVFKVNEDSIWAYAQQDTLRLKEVYESQRDRFQYGERYQFVRLSARSDSLLHLAEEAIYSGTPVDSIPSVIPEVRIRRDITSSLSSEPYSHMKGLEPGSLTPPVSVQRQKNSFLLEEVIEPREMTFDEAYNQLVSIYQNIREEEWLEAMRMKYQVETYPEVIEQILSELQ
ncbi:peptidylprolyl isomerase [Balneolaceae bacterium ANBcel3]|nr:peptidylprolyl isomerase [Balneolaceae bacterium ANBcel3]